MPPATPPAERLRVAIVGCGAVTRSSLLPVLAGHEQIDVVALIDRDAARANELARAYRVARTETDLSSITRAEFDGVVVATPPAHHAPAVLQLIGEGLHVFVEKPMAITLADATAMVEAASRADVQLSVGQFRRLLPAARLLKTLVEREHVGRPLAVDIEEGGEYTWQLATLAALTKSGGGGGVLIDLGSHVIDQLLFVMPGDPAFESYADNSRGGIETDCEARFSLATRWGAIPCRLELSRTRTLRNSVRVRCERGTLELPRSEFCRVLVEHDGSPAADPLSKASGPITFASYWSDESEMVGYEAFRSEFDDWREAILGRRSPILSGRSVLPTVRLIEQCYQQPRRLPERWADVPIRNDTDARPSNTAPAVLSQTRRRVLVTGAGGFLGCRTVELLQQRFNWDVRALVRRPSSAARLARWPIDVVVADVTSHDAVRAALEGCEAVVHCAVGTGWPPESAFAVTVEGTKTVGRAAVEAGVRRFVHISSMAVHGDRPPARLDESSPLHEESGYSYSRAKYLAEKAIMDLRQKGLPAVCLRPSRIYGPFSKTFTIRPLQALADDRFALAGDADSPANMVYVDNVAGAIAAALDAPDAVHGEAFLISDRDQLSWRAFYEFFAAAAGTAVRVVPYPERRAGGGSGPFAVWIGGVRGLIRSPELRAFAKRVMATDPIGTLPRRVWEASPALQSRVLAALGVDEAVVYRRRPAASADLVEFRIDPTLVVADKAARVLGYRPLVDRPDAMSLTLEWARWARLLPQGPIPGHVG